MILVKERKMGFFKNLFGLITLFSPKIEFNFYILNEGDPIPTGKWYQKDSWNNKSFVSYRGKWNSNWKYADDSEVKVAGISRDDRSKHFLTIAQAEDFRLHLELEPDNPVNEHAQKVMASGTVKGEFVSCQIGYLPDDIATKYAGIKISIWPKSAFLPKEAGLNVGLKITMLVRSATYLKKMEKTAP